MGLLPGGGRRRRGGRGRPLSVASARGSGAGCASLSPAIEGASDRGAAEVWSLVRCLLAAPAWTAGATASTETCSIAAAAAAPISAPRKLTRAGGRAAAAASPSGARSLRSPLPLAHPPLLPPACPTFRLHPLLSPIASRRPSCLRNLQRKCWISPGWRRGIAACSALLCVAGSDPPSAPLRVPKCLCHPEVPCGNGLREEETSETCPRLGICPELLPLSRRPLSPAGAAPRKPRLALPGWSAELGLREDY